jgi:hypothetical protein
MQEINGGVRCGIKVSAAKQDLALIYSADPCTAAVESGMGAPAASLTNGVSGYETALEALCVKGL